MRPLISIRGSVRPLVRLSVGPSVRWSVRALVGPSIVPLVRWSVRWSVRQSVCLSVENAVVVFTAKISEMSRKMIIDDECQQIMLILMEYCDKTQNISLNLQLAQSLSLGQYLSHNPSLWQPLSRTISLSDNMSQNVRRIAVLSSNCFLCFCLVLGTNGKTDGRRERRIYRRIYRHSCIYNICLREKFQFYFLENLDIFPVEYFYIEKNI